MEAVLNHLSANLRRRPVELRDGVIRSLIPLVLADVSETSQQCSLLMDILTTLLDNVQTPLDDVDMVTNPDQLYYDIWDLVRSMLLVREQPGVLPLQDGADAVTHLRILRELVLKVVKLEQELSASELDENSASDDDAPMGETGNVAAQTITPVQERDPVHAEPPAALPVPHAQPGQHDPAPVQQQDGGQPAQTTIDLDTQDTQEGLEGDVRGSTGSTSEWGC